MEIYQAAEKYIQQRKALDNADMGNYVHHCVWNVRDGGVLGYFLTLHFVLAQDVADIVDVKTSNDFAFANNITKQRGGTRYFKTLDAVAACLQQIGQCVLPLDDLDLL